MSSLILNPLWRQVLAPKTCSKLIPREVIRDVNTEILLGRDKFKLRAGHMIDKDDGFKFPSDAALFAVVKV